MHRHTMILLSAALMCAAANADAQTWPARPIRAVVPYGAGSTTDIVPRVVFEQLSSQLGQPLVVENRGGAGGTIGADLVAKAAPDGHTILMGTVGTSAINGALYSKLPHDPVRDFTPIALVASAPVAVVVHPSVPIRSVGELIEKARKAPGEVIFGSAGSGTPGHLTGEMFATAAGVKLGHIAYKGSAPAINDLLGNQIPMMFDPLQSVIHHIRAGKLRALAVSASERSPELPDVPTIAESGLKDFQTTAWWGVFAPAKLPEDVRERLSSEIARIVKSDAYKQKLGNLGVVPSPDPMSLADFQKSEVIKWGEAVRKSGAQVN